MSNPSSSSSSEQSNDDRQHDDDTTKYHDGHGDGDDKDDSGNAVVQDDEDASGDSSTASKSASAEADSKIAGASTSTVDGKGDTERVEVTPPPTDAKASDAPAGKGKHTSIAGDSHTASELKTGDQEATRIQELVDLMQVAKTEVDVSRRLFKGIARELTTSGPRAAAVSYDAMSQKDKGAVDKEESKWATKTNSKFAAAQAVLDDDKEALAELESEYEQLVRSQLPVPAPLPAEPVPVVTKKVTELTAQERADKTIDQQVLAGKVNADMWPHVNSMGVMVGDLRLFLFDVQQNGTGIKLSGFTRIGVVQALYNSSATGKGADRKQHRHMQQVDAIISQLSPMSKNDKTLWDKFVVKMVRELDQDDTLTFRRYKVTQMTQGQGEPLQVWYQRFKRQIAAAGLDRTQAHVIQTFVFNTRQHIHTAIMSQLRLTVQQARTDSNQDPLGDEEEQELSFQSLDQAYTMMVQVRDHQVALGNSVFTDARPYTEVVRESKCKHCKHHPQRKHLAQSHTTNNCNFLKAAPQVLAAGVADAPAGQYYTEAQLRVCVTQRVTKDKEASRQRWSEIPVDQLFGCFTCGDKKHRRDDADCPLQGKPENPAGQAALAKFKEQRAAKHARSGYHGKPYRRY
jgi:hypothetical protein